MNDLVLKINSGETSIFRFRGNLLSKMKIIENPMRKRLTKSDSPLLTYFVLLFYLKTLTEMYTLHAGIYYVFVCV